MCRRISISNEKDIVKALAKVRGEINRLKENT